MKEERRIVIIDDEPLIVSGLTHMDWSAVGGQVVGSALNGEAGLELIEETLPDIVISDIVMPGLTGIQLAQTCIERWPNIKIILLSAHSDFEYARQAIRLNIVDYVLKPIEPEMLFKAVGRAIAALEEQEGLFSHVSRLERENVQARQLVSSFLLFEAAQQGEEAPISGVENWREELLSKPGIFMVLRCCNIPSGQAVPCRSVMKKVFLSQMEMSGLRVFSRTETAGFTVLCRLPDDIDLTTGARRVEKAAQDAVAQVRRALAQAGMENVLCVCVLAPPYRSAQEMKNTYSLCMKCVQAAACFSTQSRVVEAQAIHTESQQISTADILHHFKHGNTEQMEDALDELLRRVERANDLEAADLLWKELHRGALHACALAGVAQLPDSEPLCEEETFRCKAERVKSWLRAVSRRLADNNDIVRSAQAMIAEHFAESGFGLGTAAQALGVSDSYLSRLFKKRTGENFNDSLLAARLKQAKFLLKTTPMQVAQIAPEVGFVESAYFAQVFKKNVGCTPSQYREQNGD